MILAIRRTLPLLIAILPLAAHAQFYKLHELHGAAVSVGITDQFTTPLTSGTGSYDTTAPFGAGYSTYPVTISNQSQTTTTSAGFLGSFEFHPVAWAGVKVNYGYTNYSERYFFNYATTPATQVLNIPVDQHEATAAYTFHPRHIPFQPFVNIGGGAIDFLPRGQYIANHWRGAGLLEAGFDLPSHMKHVTFRVAGRSLYYRAPDFGTIAISTHSWRVTEQPSVSAVYRF